MKLQEIKKQTTKIFIKSGAIVLASVVLYFAVSAWQSQVAEQQKHTEATRNQLQSDIATLKSKLENADASERNYALFISGRKSQELQIENDKVREVLQALINRYRLKVDGKLEYSAEKKVEHPELAALSRPIVLRQDVKLKFSAISDVQVFSFAKDLVEQLPGIIHYTKVLIQRKGELDTATFALLATGQLAYLVEAELTFDWYGLAPDESKDVNNASATPGAP